MNCVSDTYSLIGVWGVSVCVCVCSVWYVGDVCVGCVGCVAEEEREKGRER